MDKERLQINQTPWWVGWAIIGFLILAAFALCLLGKLAAGEFLAFSAGTLIKTPQSQPPPY